MLESFARYHIITDGFGAIASMNATESLGNPEAIELTTGNSLQQAQILYFSTSPNGTK